MKKTIVTSMLALSAFAAPAMAGNWYAGGSIGFMHRSDKEDGTTNEFTVQPEVGYNFNDRWAFGGRVGYTYRNYAGQDVNLNIFNINPYARFTYYRTSNNLVQLFVDGTVGVGLGSTSQSGSSGTACSYEVGLLPGIAFNITDHFTILAHLGFVGYHGANNRAKEGGEPEYGGVNFSSKNLSVGLYYNF